MLWLRFKIAWLNFWAGIEYFLQKIFRGYSNPEAHNFYYYHAKYCISRLKKLKTYGNSHPATMPSVGVWHVFLDAMIEAFELILLGEEKLLTKQDREKIQKGLELFVAHYFNLWD